MACRSSLFTSAHCFLICFTSNIIRLSDSRNHLGYRDVYWPSIDSANVQTYLEKQSDRWCFVSRMAAHHLVIRTINPNLAFRVGDCF